MTPKKLDLEARAEALLKRLQRHNLADGLLTEFEIKSLLKEVRTIEKENLVGSVTTGPLERVSRIMGQAIAEAKKILQK